MEILTIVADVQADREGALRALLETIKPKPRKLFKRFSMLHFASFVIFPAKTLGSAGTKLVFDFTVDDGTSQAFIDACEADFEIRSIYANCVGYASGVHYLRDRIRRPQLYHIGTPYRTVNSIRADRALRRQLDRRVFAAAHLDQLLGRSPRGTLQHWISDVLQPWLGLAVAALGVALAAAPPIASSLWRADYSRLDRITLRFIDIAGIGGVFVGLGFYVWSTALPVMRDRVKAWIPWLAASIAVGVIVIRLWAIRPWWSFAFGASFVILFALAVSTAAGNRRNERLLEIRPGPDTRSIVRIWNRLVQLQGSGDERPAWWRIVWHFRWWYGSILLTFVALLAVHRFVGRTATVLAVTSLFFSEAAGLNILSGWPAATGPWLGFSTAGARFIAIVTLSTLLLVRALMVLPQWPVVAAVLALAIFGAFFVLWGWTPPTPAAQSHPLTREALAALLEQEERDVQNHMAACVVIKESDRPIRSLVRIGVLKTFLAINNSVFFRAWLPDACKGKLFMLPTVHAAQWLVLDKRNYLFLSNYDHSWTTYLDDFGTALGQGIEKIWGQGRDNPGVADLAAFKDFARSTMVPYAVWYQAYPGLTVRQIWNNEHIRRELVDRAGEEDIARVIRRFGAAPAIPDDLVAHAHVN